VAVLDNLRARTRQVAPRVANVAGGLTLSLTAAMGGALVGSAVADHVPSNDDSLRYLNSVATEIDGFEDRSPAEVRFDDEDERRRLLVELSIHELALSHLEEAGAPEVFGVPLARDYDSVRAQLHGDLDTATEKFERRDPTYVEDLARVEAGLDAWRARPSVVFEATDARRLGGWLGSTTGLMLVISQTGSLLGARRREDE
jgi:hypothetical protein